MVLGRRFITALLLGTITCLAVAWTLASLGWGGRPGPLLQTDGTTFWMTPDYEGAGWGRTTLYPATGLTDDGRSEARPLRSWCLPVPAHAPPDSIVEIVGAGWPLVCVRGHRTGRDDTEADIARTGVIRTGLGPQAIAWNERRGTLAIEDPPGQSVRGLFPWFPVWGGLAVNTGLFMVPWLLVVHIGTARRLYRRRNGRCPACGYPVPAAGAACPECGLAG